MKRTLRLLRHYYLFSATVLSILIGGGLELTKHHTAAHWLLGVVSITEVLPLAWNMWQDVRSGKYGVNILAVTAIITAVILGQYWTGIIMVLLLTGNQGLKDFAERQAKRELDILLKHAPQTAHVLRKGKTVEVHVNELHPGDKVIVKAGERVPADAVVLEGMATFDESSLTGESLPQAKQVGELLLSGSVCLDDSVTARVVATANDSHYQQITRLVKSASASQTPLVRLTQFYSLPFTLLSFGIAAAAWVLSGQAIRFLEVIVVATPYPLLVAPPIALAGGLVRASRCGIIVKTGIAFEKLSKARSIAFNKTGTLTRGQLAVDTIKTSAQHEPDEVLRLAASLEQGSNHTVAQAIVEAAKAKQLKLAKTKHVQSIPSRGLKTVLQGQEIVVGQFSYIQELGIELPAKFQLAKLKQTAVYVARDSQIVGMITFKDEPRSEAEVTLNQLQGLGLSNTIMVTGDSQAAAQNVASQLGINEVHTNMLPADKIHAIENFKHRPLVFVGNEQNDALALAAADVGIALGARNLTTTSEAADLIITTDDLSHLALAVALAKRTFKIARQSILAGLGLSLVLMLIFATGKVSPLTGVFLQEVIVIYVIINALRARF